MRATPPQTHRTWRRWSSPLLPSYSSPISTVGGKAICLMRVNAASIRPCLTQQSPHALAVYIFDADGGVGVCLNFLNDLSAWADDGTDAVARNFQAHDAWGVVFVIVTWLGDFREHRLANVVTSFTGPAPVLLPVGKAQTTILMSIWQTVMPSPGTGEHRSCLAWSSSPRMSEEDGVLAGFLIGDGAMASPAGQAA